LETELHQVKNNNMSSVDEKMSTKDQEDTLMKLREEHENIDQQGKTELDQRFTNMKEMEENFDRQLKAVREAQRAEMEEKRNLNSQKMLADATAY
jgi:type IV secretory pathway VirB4 component